MMKPKAPLKARPSRTGPKAEGEKRTILRGYGAMREVPLNLDPRIDLKKPIYEQVLELENSDKAKQP